MGTAPEGGSFRRRLDRIYAAYTLGFLAFVAVLAVGEHVGLTRYGIGIAFLITTIALYAGIGIISRTTDEAEYYVAGRRVPAFYNGMAIGADWMSAASFIGLSGTLYLSGFGGLAYTLGWTGGFCLVALLLAPYLRRFGQYTIPDFLGARYGSNGVRVIGAGAAVLCSFTYLVAQIYGVGLITARLTGVDLVVGIFLGLGGILVCSFLGGMRAVTWTQVAQYIVLIIAFLVPVIWLGIEQTGVAVPQLAAGLQLGKLALREQQLIDDPKEREVIAAFQAQADAVTAQLRDVPAALSAERLAAERHRAAASSPEAIRAADRELVAVPNDEASARTAWLAALAEAKARARPLAGMPRHAEAFAGDAKAGLETDDESGGARRNFMATVFCLMVGTAALPHLLVRCYTTPSVRETRRSLTWAIFFIVLLYLSAPALAVMVKYQVFHGLVGLPFDHLPAWIGAWAKVDPTLVSVVDINHDGVLQLGELHLGQDVVVLAAPEIAGLPYVVSGMVAAGGLAAALSTADGLLLTIANALSHDLYYKVIAPHASSATRVMLSKTLLLVVALTAAAVAAQRPADIVFLVSAAFSLAASALFPALAFGVFWKRANAWGAAAGMIAGLAVAMAYMVINEPWLRQVFGVQAPAALWWGIRPVCAGVFGVPVGVGVLGVVSLLTAPPPPALQTLVDALRGPDRSETGL